MAATGTATTAQQRRSFSWLGPGPVLHAAALFILFGSAVFVGANQLQPSSDLAHQNGGEICESVDIRNTLDSFNRLKGCHVVEGFVQILLFDNVNETELSLLSFPNLTEITDYLLLYRVNGLRSIGQLFPNLSVIRGRSTFYTYSFVVFEMSSLQEIGLYSLTDITRGLIRIDKNPSLCFVNSIDWEAIAHEKGEHFIKNLKSPNECPICPGDEKEDESSNSVAHNIHCHKAPHRSDSENFDRDVHLCWNRQHCQKICPPKCKHACNANLECCDESCLGGCSINDTKLCTVCKNLSMKFGANKQCMSSCPRDYYQYLERRCILKDECKNMKRPLNFQQQGGSEKPFKIFNNSCILECPPNYMSNDTHCIPCQGNCIKKCAGVNVDSINLARQLKGCTHITSSLEIQIRGGRNVVNELEESLGMIEEIDGYLKVVRSFPLVSLNFLKNLKVIHGRQLESQKYVFVVLDNQNLQELWNWENNKTLKIDTGRLFFHFNPKLCIREIEKLQNITHIVDVTELEVAKNSNGDKIACDLQVLKVDKPKVVNSKGVVLEWEPFKIDDPRKLLGYIVYSIEAPTQNVTLYDGRDACGGDGWRVDDVAIPENEMNVTHPLTSLKPYTQYAFYVKTYTIATERRGAQSNISYFTTLPDTPTAPVGLEVVSNSSNSLKLSWRPPKSPNGKLTHYIVSLKRHNSTSPDLDEMEHYCKSPSSRPKHLVPVSVPPLTSTTTNNDTCQCSETKQSTSSINEDVEKSRIDFEDELHNAVYVRKPNFSESRKRRDTDTEHSNTNRILNETEPGTGVYISFSTEVTGTEFYMPNLRHYTVYEINVQACREKTNDKLDTAPFCSSRNMKTHRTLKKKGADDIKQIEIKNQSLGMVSLTWKEPDAPNGLIYCYIIEYKNLDKENSKANEEYITHARFINQSRIHTLKALSPGNYSVRVSATTSGDYGKFSKEAYFYIEERPSNTYVTLIVCMLILVISLALCAFCFYKKKKADKESMRLIPSVNPEYVPSVYVPDEWEVPRKKIELIRELGQGSFGMVYEGIAQDVRGKAQIKCAVKTVNEHATNRERLEFLNEASVMKAFDTAHVVRLLGVVSQGQPTLVIMELMANGDLKTYLRSHRPDAEVYDPATAKQPPTLKQILQMAIEIADGMAYLSAKKFVHRDLAARNCMVAEDLTVKIGDFGMTRDIYETDYYRKGTKGLLPVRWMAPESLKDGVFTSNSDVWSYGVVLWEMATLASQPYQGLSNDQVLRYVIDGGVMERPENCPDKLYTLMRYCWQHKPSARPSFLKLCSLLLEDASTSFAQVSFYHSAAGIEARSSRPTPSPSQDDPSTPLRMAGDHDVNFSLNSDDSNDEFETDAETHIRFPSIPVENKDGITTANGYVSGCPTNGAATTQC
ncbi:insulin-like receptor [Tribolium madens]|uniref:insulin-like receptor n=1 Tax=Tribolium madens TaxID=41895 RepID=UPI001CF76623|nr:insulin-like receptor [Tribolium madens]XP_044256885.1 insulin-like receptor [Tribolium madens]XP_044256886.1 insulin-like receptor [Tribolium madens]